MIKFILKHKIYLTLAVVLIAVAYVSTTMLSTEAHTITFSVVAPPTPTPAPDINQSSDIFKPIIDFFVNLWDFLF